MVGHGPLVGCLVVFGSGRHRRAAAHHPRLRAHRSGHVVAVAVGASIGGAYFFTSSTSFANPAITIARSLTNTFAGIAPPDVPVFIVGQLAGAACAALMAKWLFD